MIERIADPIFEIIQMITFIFIIIFATFCFLWMRKKSNNWMWGIIPMGIAIHAALFYLAVLCRNVGVFEIEHANFFTNWSAVLRAHSYSSAAILAVGLYYRKSPGSLLPWIWSIWKGCGGNNE